MQETVSPSYIGLIRQRLDSVTAGSAPGLRSEIAYLVTGMRSLVVPDPGFDDTVERLLRHCERLRDALLARRGAEEERTAALSALAAVEERFAHPGYPPEMDRLIRRFR